MNRPTHVVRHATTADIPAVVGLLAQLLKSDPEITADAATQTEGLQALFASDAVLFVLEVEMVVVGFVNLQSIISTGFGRRRGVIQDLVLDAAFTGQEWGEVLLEALLAEAEKRDFPNITLSINASNAGALRFLGRKGFCASSQIPMVYDI